MAIEDLIEEYDTRSTLQETLLRREFVLAYQKKLELMKDSMIELDIIQGELDNKSLHNGIFNTSIPFPTILWKKDHSVKHN